MSFTIFTDYLLLIVDMVIMIISLVRGNGNVMMWLILFHVHVLNLKVDGGWD